VRRFLLQAGDGALKRFVADAMSRAPSCHVPRTARGRSPGSVRERNGASRRPARGVGGRSPDRDADAQRPCSGGNRSARGDTM
jgi:hypothetical protein